MSEGTLALGCFDNGRKWLELANVGRFLSPFFCPFWPIPAIFCHYQNSPRQVSLLTFTNNKTAQADVLSGVPATVLLGPSQREVGHYGGRHCCKLPQKHNNYAILYIRAGQSKWIRPRIEVVIAPCNRSRMQLVPGL